MNEGNSVMQILPKSRCNSAFHWVCIWMILGCTLWLSPFIFYSVSCHASNLAAYCPQIFGADTMIGLKAWKKVVEPWRNFGASHFRSLFPPDPKQFGEVYWLIEPPEELRQFPSLSSNRYLPPMLFTPAEILIHQLLQMVHPRPFVLTRFAPQGSVACVRAYNDRVVDIAFRWAPAIISFCSGSSGALVPLNFNWSGFMLSSSWMSLLWIRSGSVQPSSWETSS